MSRCVGTRIPLGRSEPAFSLISSGGHADPLWAVVTQVFPDEFHLHTLDQFLPATARLHHHVNIKAIVIGLMNRLSTYAAREAEAESQEQRRSLEEEAVVKMVKRLRITDSEEGPSKGPHVPQDEPAHTDGDLNSDHLPGAAAQSTSNGTPDERPTTNFKRRSIPDEIKLSEIFYDQVVRLVNVQRLPIQDTIALLVSLTNLALYVPLELF